MKKTAYINTNKTLYIFKKYIIIMYMSSIYFNYLKKIDEEDSLGAKQIHNLNGCEDLDGLFLYAKFAEISSLGQYSTDSKYINPFLRIFLNTLLFLVK